MNPVTSGPVVNQYMQTSIPSIFACGNVVHVHDLVDNVSRESETAGQEAARYALGAFPKEVDTVPCVPGNNVRYICPQHISLTGEDTEINLYFRVSAPDTKVSITAHLGDKELFSKKAMRVNPGEMEKATIKSSDLKTGNVTVDVVKEN
jgi:hypothetical protein